MRMRAEGVTEEAKHKGDVMCKYPCYAYCRDLSVSSKVAMKMRVEGVTEEAKQEGDMMYGKTVVEVTNHALVCSGTGLEADGTLMHSTDTEYLVVLQIHANS